MENIRKNHKKGRIVFKINFLKKKFLKYQAQTTNYPMALEISYAEGSFIYDINNKKYLDFVSGVSASNLGHRNKAIVKAVKKQIDKFELKPEDLGFQNNLNINNLIWR